MNSDWVWATIIGFCVSVVAVSVLMNSLGGRAQSVNRDDCPPGFGYVYQVDPTTKVPWHHFVERDRRPVHGCVLRCCWTKPKDAVPARPFARLFKDDPELAERVLAVFQAIMSEHEDAKSKMEQT